MQSGAVPDVSHGAPNNPPMRAARRRTMGSPDVLRMTPLPLQMSAIPRPADRLADATEMGKRAALHSPAAAAKPLHSCAPGYEFWSRSAFSGGGVAFRIHMLMFQARLFFSRCGTGGPAAARTSRKRQRRPGAGDGVNALYDELRERASLVGLRR